MLSAAFTLNFEDQFFPGLAHPVQALVRVIQHIERISPAGTNCFQVVLNTDYGVGQTIQQFGRKVIHAVPGACVEDAGDPAHHTHGPGPVKH